MKCAVATVLISVLSVAEVYAQTSHDNAWLLGTWWYADSSGRIVEGEDKDGLRFRSNGTVDLVYGSGKAYLSCTYTDGFAGKLRIDCIVRDQPRALIFLVDAERTRLANVEDIDKGFYRRADRL